MPATILAEAGLSECVRADTGCMSGFGQFMVMWLLIGVLGTLWLSAALYATVEILIAKVGVVRAAVWLLAVWGLPLLGVIVWLTHGRSRAATEGEETL